MHPMTRAYLEALCFTETADDDSPFDSRFEFHADTIAKCEADCLKFLEENADDIGTDYEQAGHDFWLTRNRHGAGFWDGDWPKEAGQRLTDAAHKAGEVWAYIGDDHFIYI